MKNQPAPTEDVLTATRYRDAPDLIVYPLIIPFVVIAAGILLDRLSPLGLLGRLDQIWRFEIGGPMLAAGLYVAGIGRRTLLRRGTNVDPRQPAVALVTDGIFTRTRNPIYVGGSFILVGIALVFALDWVLPLFVMSLPLLHFGVVLPEERYLESKFGEGYRRYRASVARYVGLG